MITRHYFLPSIYLLVLVYLLGAYPAHTQVRKPNVIPNMFLGC